MSLGQRIMSGSIMAKKRQKVIPGHVSPDVFALQISELLDKKNQEPKIEKSNNFVERQMIGLMDSLVNLISNVGTQRDPRSATVFTSYNDPRYGQYSNALEFNRNLLEAMYATDWLSGKGVDLIPDTMTREWRTVSFGNDTAKQKQFKDVENYFNIKSVFNDAMRWARLYGGSVIIFGIDGAGDNSQPLDFNRIKRGSLKWIQCLDRWYISPEIVNTTDLTSNTFYEPEYYRIATSNMLVHKSRLIKFIGLEPPRWIKATLNYWGYSILGRAYDSLINAALAPNTTASLLLRSNWPVLTVPDLANMLSSDQGTSMLSKRIGAANLLASNQNMTVIDSKETLTEMKPDLTAGVPLMQKFIEILSGVFDIPVSLLAGRSLSGLNVTGDSEIRNHYDAMKSKQINELEPSLKIADQILLRHAFGEVPADYEWEFNPLWQLTDQEQADLELKNAQRDQIYLNMGIVTEDIVAKQLQQNGTYTAIDDEYVQALQGIKYENPNQDYQNMTQEDGNAS